MHLLLILPYTVVAISYYRIFGAVQFTWSPAADLSIFFIANPIASPVSASNYKVVGTDAAGCKDSAFVNVNVYSRAIADAGPDKNIFLVSSTTLSASIIGEFDSFTWLPSIDIIDPQVLQPTVALIADATYTF